MILSKQKSARQNTFSKKMAQSVVRPRRAIFFIIKNNFFREIFDVIMKIILKPQIMNIDYQISLLYFIGNTPIASKILNH